MPRPYQYAPLTPADRQNLWHVARKKWVSFFKGIFYFIALAVIALVALYLAAITLLLHPKNRHTKPIDFSSLYSKDTLIEDAVLLTPISFFVIVASSIWLLSSVMPVYIDLLKGKKRLYRFSPRPYNVAGTNKYYIHIGLPGRLFMPVSYEQYMAFDYSRDCYLEISPRSKITLGFQTIE